MNGTVRVWAKVLALHGSQGFDHGEYTLDLMVVTSNSSISCILSCPGTLMGNFCSQVCKVKPNRDAWPCIPQEEGRREK